VLVDPAQCAPAIFNRRWSQRHAGHAIFNIDQVHPAGDGKAEETTNIPLYSSGPTAAVDVNQRGPDLGTGSCRNHVQFELMTIRYPVKLHWEKPPIGKQQSWPIGKRRRAPGHGHK